MATEEGVQRALDLMNAARARPRAEEGALTEFGRGVGRGVAQFPADTRAMSEFARGQQPSEETEQLRGVLAGPQPTNRPQGLIRDVSAITSDAPPSDRFSGRFGERVGRSLPFAALGAPVAAATGGLPGVVAEVAADLVAVSAAEASAEVGAPSPAQLFVELTAAILVPGATIQKQVAKAPIRGSKLSRKAAAKFTAERRAGRFGHDPQPIEVDAENVRRIAKEYGLSEEAVRKTVSEVKRRMGKDPAGGERLIADAVEEVKANIALFPDRNKRPPTSALLGDKSGQNLPAMQKALSISDVDFSADMDGIKQVVERDLQEQFARLQPNGGIDGVRRNFGSAEKLLDEEEGIAWARAKASSDELPMIQTKRLKQSTNEAVRRSGGFPGRTPDEVKVIRELPDEITMDEFQALRSNALLTGRVAKRGGEVSQFKASSLAPILEALNKELEDLPAGVGSAEYRRALSLTRRNKQILDPKSAGVSAVSEFGDPRRSVNRIRGAKDPAEEARKAIELLSMSPDGDGVKNLRAVFVEELFGSDITKASPRSVLIKIKQHRGMYAEVLGEETLQEFEKLAKKMRIHARFSAGTSAAIKETGSSIPQVAGKLFAASEIFKHPLSATGDLIQKQLIKRDMTSNADVHGLMREMLKDGDLFVRLMSVKEDRAVAQWIVDWNILVARSRATQQAARSGGRSASGLAVNQPLPPQGPQGQGIQ